MMFAGKVVTTAEGITLSGVSTETKTVNGWSFGEFRFKTDTEGAKQKC